MIFLKVFTFWSVRPSSQRHLLCTSAFPTELIVILRGSRPRNEFINKRFLLSYFVHLQSDAGSGSEQSDNASTPQNNAKAPSSQTSPSTEATQENTSDGVQGKVSLSRRGSKNDKSKKEKPSKETSDKPVKSKSPDKPRAVVEPLEKSEGGEGSSEEKQSDSTLVQGNLIPKKGTRRGYV